MDCLPLGQVLRRLSTMLFNFPSRNWNSQEAVRPVRPILWLLNIHQLLTSQRILARRQYFEIAEILAMVRNASLRYPLGRPDSSKHNHPLAEVDLTHEIPGFPPRPSQT